VGINKGVVSPEYKNRFFQSRRISGLFNTFIFQEGVYFFWKQGRQCQRRGLPCSMKDKGFLFGLIFFIGSGPFLLGKKFK